MSADGKAVEVFEPGAGVLGTIDTATGEASGAIPAVPAVMRMTAGISLRTEL